MMGDYLILMRFQAGDGEKESREVVIGSNTAFVSPKGVRG
jgi:hypothetical protein